MDRLPFWKLSGSGNDFVIIDNRRGAVAREDGAALSRHLCARRFSVGADGLILIRRSRRADFGWDFFNADGSVAEMCGNGGRCAARFAYLKGIAPARMAFETLAGLVRAEVRGERVKLELPPPEGYRRRIPLAVAGRRLAPAFIVVGVPHAVLRVTDIEGTPVERLGSAIRRHRAFAPAGANANFYRVAGPRRLEVRTYERGVEAETLACGTGSVASALVATAAGEVRSPVRVRTRGGETLTVYIRHRDGEVRELFLEGGARVVYEGRTAEISGGEAPRPRRGAGR